jgi:hypothetical protein
METCKQCSLLSFIEQKPQINTDSMLRKFNRMKPIDLFKEGATVERICGDINKDQSVEEVRI